MNATSEKYMHRFLNSDTSLKLKAALLFTKLLGVLKIGEMNMDVMIFKNNISYASSLPTVTLTLYSAQWRKIFSVCGMESI